MKLKPVPAKTGLLWVRQGITTFARQPLALSGLFLLYMLALSLLSALPVIGNLLALALLPATTLGLMVATREADSGKFPMPALLASAFAGLLAVAMAVETLERTGWRPALVWPSGPQVR